MSKGRLLLSMEDSQNVANYFGSKKLLEQSMETPEEIIRKIEKVTLEEVVAVAKDLFQPANLNFALIGPFHQEEFSIEDLHMWYKSHL